MKTKKMADIVLVVTTYVAGKLARYFAIVDIPMATSAPMALRTVPSSCWARFSWMAKISSLTVRSRNTYGPPRAENGRIAMTRQHKRVESILAIARLLTSPVLTRAVLMVDKRNMGDNGRWGSTSPFEFFSSFFGHYENDPSWSPDKRQVTQITRVGRPV